MRRSMLLLVLALFSVGVVAAGCGGGDDTETTEAEEAQETTAPAGKPEKTVEIKMADYSFDPSKVSVPAGTIEISAPNVGKVEHELVLFKTDQNPADLPVSGGEVDEQGLEDKGAENAGELEAAPGETATGSFELSKGKYAMICNLPGHYQRGMYGSVVAK